jgi:hypothetical protein
MMPTISRPSTSGASIFRGSFKKTPAVKVGPESGARRARYFLYVLGAAFVALGFSLEMVPALIAAVPPLAGRVCARVGAAVLTAGRFGVGQICAAVRDDANGMVLGSYATG